MAGKIFLNYRRDDDAGFTHALYLRLEDEFSSGDLFMDVEGHIKPGDNFFKVLNDQVAAADVVLVVIGPRWADLLAVRQGDRNDFVAIEIKAALDQGKRVIPVLVGGAGLPRADTLPEAIRPLAFRHAVGLRPERFRADCQGLISELKDSFAAPEQERAGRTKADRKAAEAARLEAEAQAAARVIAAEERGRAQAAAGFSAEGIRKAEELANWDFVKDRNDIHDLRDHLARYPGSLTERWARAKLDGLVWTGLGSTPAIEQLRAYLDEFPSGANAETAQARIVALEREAAEVRAAELQHAQEPAEWTAVAASTDRGVTAAFLERWPNGQHAETARGRIAALEREAAEARAAAQRAQETAEWGAVAESGDKGAIEAFLERWPNGQHAEAASARIGRIKVDARFFHGAPDGWFLPGNGKVEWFQDQQGGPEMVVIPVGSFLMGSPEVEQSERRWRPENPQHLVTIERPFGVARYAVTRGQFAAFVKRTGYVSKDEAFWRNPGFPQDDSHPAVYVNWEDAKAFAAWLSSQSGRDYRLLTEAEWEYAARACTMTPFWCGSTITSAQANYDGRVIFGSDGAIGKYRRQTVAASSFSANPWGLYQVHGNVWEWCEDVWHNDYNGAPSDGSAWLLGGMPNCRVVRGGSWVDFPEFLRSANRYRYSANARHNNLGFRVARTITP